MEEIRGIIVRNQSGRRIVLADVAEVYRGTKDRDVIARLNGKESVELAIYKEADANTVTVAGAVEQRLESLKKANLMPKGVGYQTVFNQAEFIKMAIDDVLDSAIIGGILAILVLFVFLRDLKSTLIIGFTIPVSILGTFGIMYQTGLSLNLMSLGGIALAVGMLLDNSIVVLEAVHRHKGTGMPVKEAVYKGTEEVAAAMVASTFTEHRGLPAAHIRGRHRRSALSRPGSHHYIRPARLPRRRFHAHADGPRHSGAQELPERG